MSTVILQSIKWDNCFSFGPNNYVDLNKESVTQIIGPNGFGKSSIPLIIEECLYNKNSKGVKKGDIANRNLKDPYSIEIDLLIDNDEYQINVIRSGASVKANLFKNGEDISSHTATATFKEIQELIGLDFKIFQQLVYQSTNNSLQFLSATDTTRKKFLIELFDLSRYTELFERFKAEVTTISNQLSKLEGQVSTIERWLRENISLTLDKQETKKIPVRPDFSEEIASLSINLKDIENKNSLILKNENNKKKLDAIDISSIEKSLENKEIKSYDRLQKEIGSLTSVKNSSSNIVAKLKSLEDKCPTCLQDIDTEFYNNLILEHSTIIEDCISKLVSLEQEMKEIKETNAFIVSANKKLEEYEQLKSLIDFSLDTVFLDSVTIEEELTRIRDTQARIEADIAKIESYNRDVDKHNNKIDIYLERSAVYSTELEKVCAELNILKSKLKTLDVLKTAFSTNGLIAYKLENLVKDLELYTNEYLAELSDGRFTIEFSISNDKLNVILTDEGKEISISSPSSGEMARINISTLLAIRKLMSGISKNTINVLFLDEVISVLDDYGRERLVEVLLKEVGLNTFLVSHSWTHPLVDKLEVKQTDGISWLDHG